MKRIPKQRKTRDTILILTNGKQTEKNFFNNITSYYRTMFAIEVKFLNEQCDDLVKHAIQVDREKYNQIWCVFDIDDSLEEGHLLIALQLAKKNDIQIAYSNEAFEVWLLYHLCDNVKTNLTRKTYIKEINNILQEQNCNYKKNDIDILKTIFIPNTLEATQKAKKHHQKLIAEHQKEFCGNTNYPIWKWKSDTTIYQLIEKLNLTPKN